MKMGRAMTIKVAAADSEPSTPLAGAVEGCLGFRAVKAFGGALVR